MANQSSETVTIRGLTWILRSGISLEYRLLYHPADFVPLRPITKVSCLPNFITLVIQTFCFTAAIIRFCMVLTRFMRHAKNIIASRLRMLEIPSGCLTRLSLRAAVASEAGSYREARDVLPVCRTFRLRVKMS